MAAAAAAVGMPAELKLPGVEAPVGGQVRLVDQEVDKASRTGKARIALADVSHAHIGAFASGEVDLVARDGVGAPTTAVKRDGDAALALVVRDGKVEERKVKLGIVEGDDGRDSASVSPRAKRSSRAPPRSCGRATGCGRCRALVGAGG